MLSWHLHSLFPYSNKETETQKEHDLTQVTWWLAAQPGCQAPPLALGFGSLCTPPPLLQHGVDGVAAVEPFWPLCSGHLGKSCDPASHEKASAGGLQCPRLTQKKLIYVSEFQLLPHRQPHEPAQRG